jgi:vacuolar protein sorting-associated protein 52
MIVEILWMENYKKLIIIFFFLEPELNKLKSKACSRVRSFLIEKLNLLKKPKTNIQIMQNNVLMKYRIFTQFLREHYLDVYVELCNIYSEIMGKIYFTNFKTYISEINKLMIDLYTKQDTLLNENSQMLRAMLQTRGTTLNQQTRSIFCLMERDEVLSNMDQDPIIFHVASQANRKILLESFFKSVNKLLLDSVASEYIFTLDFFNLRSDQNKVVFEGVFRQTINFTLESIKNILSNTFDIVGLLLMILLNEKNKKNFNSRGLNVLDSFFEQVNMFIWPRFEMLFEQHLNSLRLINMKVYKILERGVGVKVINTRFIDLSISLYKLYSYFDDNKMLWSRMVQMRTLFFELMRKSAKEFPSEHERTKYLIDVFDSILSAFYGIHSAFEKKEFQEDLLNLEKELNGYIDQLVELYLKDYFGNLIDFVRKYAREEIKDVGNLELDGFDVTGGGNQDLVGKKDFAQNVNVKLIEHINNELNESWNKRIDAVKNEAEKTFASSNALKLIIKKFLTNFLAYYNSFFKYVKNYYPSYLNSIIPLHLIMKEVKASMKKYNI